MQNSSSVRDSTLSPFAVEAGRIKGLIDYVEQVIRLDERPVFRLDEYRLPTGQSYIFRQPEFQALPGVTHDLNDDDGPLWLTVERLERDRPPALPEILKDWVQLSPDPDRTPVLRQSLLQTVSQQGANRMIDENLVRPEDCAPSLKEGTGFVDIRLRAEDRPELAAAFEAFTGTSWLPWAESERPRRKTIALYQRLFEVAQQFDLAAADQPLELVWGLGLARWQTNDHAIDLPLVERLVEIEITESARGEIRIRPRVAAATVNLRPYDALQVEGVPLATDAANRAIAAAGEDGVSPFVRDSFETILRACQTRLDPGGVYLPDQAPDAAAGAASEHLSVSDEWVVYARRRSDNFLLADLRNLKEAIDKAGDALPSPARTLVMGPKDSGGSSWGTLGVTIGEGIATSVPDEHPASPLGDLFFPKPFNDAQVEIVHRLEAADGIVVQGPPGTGKTHTISNIICHYLATGRRVLVVSHGEPALAVLRDQLPPEIRDLAISITSSEREGFRQIETAVRLLQSVVETIRPNEQRRLIEDTERAIVRIRARLAEIDAELASFAQQQLKPVVGLPLLPAELAANVVRDAGQFDWFTDRPRDFIRNLPLTPADVARLKEARQAVAARLDEIDARLPSVHDLPDEQAVERMHTDLLQAEELGKRAAIDPMIQVRLHSASDIEGAHTLIEQFSALDEIHGHAEQHPWLRPLLTAGDPSPISGLLAAFLADARQSAQEHTAYLQRPVDYPTGFHADPAIMAIVSRLASGEAAFGMFAFKERSLRPVIDAIRVSAQPPAGPADWQHVAGHLQWQARADSLARRWEGLAAQIDCDLPARSPLHVSRLVSMLTPALETWPRLVHAVSSTVTLLVSGVQARELTHDAALRSHVRQLLEAAAGAAKLAAANQEVARLEALFGDQSGRVGELARSFLNDVLGRQVLEQGRAGRTWQLLRSRVDTHAQLRVHYRAIDEMTARLAASGAPQWANRLRTKPASQQHDDVIPDHWVAAWDWAAALTLLEGMDHRALLKALSEERLTLERDLAKSFERLVRERTFFALGANLKGPVRAALMAFAAAVRRIGRGTGAGAVRHRRAARDAMAKCYDAVPCWIMPSWRVSEQLPAELGAFDLVIMDEASQSDIKEVTALLRGKKVLIVGDDKQVSPSAAFIENNKLDRLERAFLQDQPFKTLLLPGSSLHDLAKVMFPDKFVMLREHFRCVEPLIRFSMQFYPEPLIPLRIPAAAERLDPPLVDIYVADGRRTGDKVNQREADVIVAEIKKVIGTPDLAKIPGTDRFRTIGVVSLIGNKQAALINRILIDAVGEEAIVRHKIACGDSATFQGNERDIVFLSMTADPGKRSSQTAIAFEQRFNVALSRARDRMVLVRSVKEEQLNPADLKARVIRHFHEPMAGVPTAAGNLLDKCDSQFERDVAQRLLDKGYRVRPQVGALGFRIDLVVEGDNDRRLAVELDGDQYHGPERWADDMRRQRILERVGWRFWRCWASSFTLDADGCIADLVDTLERAGIQPGAGSVDENTYTEHRVVSAPKTELTPTPVNDDDGGDGVVVGDRVTVRYLDTNKIECFTVTIDKNDPVNGLLSVASPLGKGMLGLSVDEEFEFETGGSRCRAMIVSIGRQDKGAAQRAAA